MRAAIHLHLYYPDVALDLIERVARLGRADIDVLATFAGTLDPDVDRALDRIPGRVVRIETPNRGWDIGPLFDLLPLIREEGYGAVAHLHTKKGDSGFAGAWREMAYEGLIADAPLLGRILQAFEERSDLMILGSASLYKSSAAHQFRNAEIISALAPRMLAPMYPLADWGFFAGTFFWARPQLIERVARVADFSSGDSERDGTHAHALERLFGLAPVADGGAIGLVDGDGAISIATAPGEPSHEPIINSLALHAAKGGAAAPDQELGAFVAAHNPLVHHIRHARDEDALDPNPYFATRWYNRVQGDMYAAGMHPLHHYILHGAGEGRSTGPLFDSDYYRRTHGVSGDALRHFLEQGCEQGLATVPPPQLQARNESEFPCRFYKRFDIAAESAFLRGIAQLPPDQARAAAETKVSVIMPAYNRETTIAAAIRSVLTQTHANFELIVVDDGSTDATREIVRELAADPRVTLVEGTHGGVSAARNLGLEQASGELVAYLDSDNRWNGWFLEVMTRFMVSQGLDVAYSAISLRDDAGQLTGYIGDRFDWDACLRQNYVDLNAFVHRRTLLAEVGGFDPRLRRMVDWDLILRATKGREVGFAPFLGCDYSDAKLTPGRVTTAEPAAFQRLVTTKNRYGLAVGSPEFMQRLSLRFAIKVAAPEDDKAAWGDWHYAESLAAAISALGHEVSIDFRGQWHVRSLADEDVVIVIRGLIPYEPRPGQLAFLWNISHPDQVSYQEYDSYSRVYLASDSYADFLRHIVRPPVTALLQATDPERFHPVDDPARAPDLLFVGNSRGVERDIVRWAIDAGRPPYIYGGGWDGLVPPQLVKGDNVDNRALGTLYAGAGAVLNDHWPSMAAFGMVANRLFDVVAAGGKALSDRVPSIARIFGSAVTEVSGPDELRRAADRLQRAEGSREAAEKVIAEHSFATRARTIVGDALGALGLDPPFAQAEMAIAPAKPPLRAHLVVPYGGQGPQSSAYIRLLSPLTDESIVGRVAVTMGAASDPIPPCDVCIVQRAALPSIEAVDRLVGTLGAMGAALVVDVDDAFVAMDDHPEAAVYRPLNAVIERAIAAAAETWFSTPELARLYAHVAHRHAIMPNMLDPRIWRDWRNARPAPFGRSAVRMLYMGTNTHGADFALLRPALERLAEERPGCFELTLVGVGHDIDGAPWLYRQSPPGDMIAYPRFVRWLRSQGPYDVGLAPLVETPFNRAKSDIKLLDYLALGMLPVVQDCPAYRLDPDADRVARHASDWFETLRGVIDDRDAARDCAATGHGWLWEKRTVAAIAAPMIARLEALL